MHKRPKPNFLGTRRARDGFFLLITLLLASALPVPAAPTPSDLSGDQEIVHALNRLAFGPRPGDVERVRAMGLTRWIDQQLNPNTIPDAAVETKLAGLKTLKSTMPQLHFAYLSDVLGFLKRQQQQTAAAAKKPSMPGMGKGARAQLLQYYMGLVEKANIPFGTSVQTVGELATAKITRAVESQRQLQEVLTDFWTNHFNVDVKKESVRTYVIADERDAIRPHVLGRFRDLLEAVARSPAMLTYLDSTSNRKGAPNENYARELMELHTLGVGGGYTQKDVQEVARCLTGWGLNPLTGVFQFHPEAHDDGPKVVLGQTIPAGGGIEDGEKVLDILASRPSTANFIARKLCVRFVSDNPPAALVDRVARVFRDTGGDLRATVRAIVTSPEFFSPEAYRAKIKSPFELAVSAVRAVGGEVTPLDDADPLDRLRLVADGSASTQDADGGRILGRRQSLAAYIAQMGEPLYACQPPTGYTENSQEWVSAGALIARLNFALALTSGGVRGLSAPVSDLLDGVSGDSPQAVLDRLGTRLLGAPLSPAMQATLKKQMSPGTPPDPQRLIALVLGSPEFQRR